MIHVFIGTKAQLIKMAPVMVELQQRNIPYNFIFSGQHQATVRNIREEFGLKDPDITLYSGKDITGIFQMLAWSLRIIFFALKNRREVWQGDKHGVVLNHGDTFSTLLGSMLARLAGQRSAHVESGLRSFNLLQPFPEELTRILTFKLSNIYFAPGEWALSNLEKYTGTKINTVHNTLLDSLRLSEQAIDASDIDIPSHRFAIGSIHRFENIFSKTQLEKIIQILIKISNDIPVLLILHKPTEQKLVEFGMMESLKRQRNIELRPRYSYFEFVKLVKHADLVITDGGSNQEECCYIGKPCIIMRSTSERQEGIGQNAVICNYEYEIAARVLNDLEQYQQAPERKEISPSAIIVDALSHQNMGESASASVGSTRAETIGAKSERSALENR
jgi:UDP-N-acetylglucosamine 2-epimerase (non-hydrolysing)